MIQYVRQKDFPAVERLLLDGYDHVTDLFDNTGRSIVDIAKKCSSRQIYEVVRLGDAIQVGFNYLFVGKKHTIKTGVPSHETPNQLID